MVIQDTTCAGILWSAPGLHGIRPPSTAQRSFDPPLPPLAPAAVPPPDRRGYLPHGGTFSEVDFGPISTFVFRCLSNLVFAASTFLCRSKGSIVATPGLYFGAMTKGPLQDSYKILTRFLQSPWRHIFRSGFWADFVFCFSVSNVDIAAISSFVFVPIPRAE